MRLIKTILILLAVFSTNAFGLELKKKIIPFEIRVSDPIYKSSADMRIVGKNVFVVENFKHRLLKFEIKDKLAFKTQVGRPGQGPGDLHLPVRLSISNSKIAVNDSQGFSIFDLKGNFLYKFRTFSPSSSFRFHDDNIYCTIQNPNQNHLIEVYSREGKKIMEMGKKYLDLKKHYKEGKLPPFRIDFVFYRNILVVSSQKVYYFDRNFGTVFLFDKKTGKQLKKVDLSPLFKQTGEAIITKNLDLVKNGLSRSNRGRNYYLIEDARLVGDFIYLFCFDDYKYKLLKDEPRENYIMRIRVLDKEKLEMAKMFEIPLNRKSESIQSIDVIVKDGKPHFYFAMDDEASDNYIAEYK